MKMKDFRLYLKENEDSISEISYILPDDSETKSKGTRIPEMVENQPYFSASVLLNAGTDEEGETLILVQNPRVLNAQDVDTLQKPVQKPNSSEPVEVLQARAFYESMMQVNTLAYTKIFEANSQAQKYVMDAMRENEKVLDRRLKTFLKDARNENPEDFEPDGSLTPNDPPDSLKTITDAVVNVFRRVNEKELKDE